MEFITREIVGTNWLTIVIIMSFTLLVIAKQMNVLRFSDFMMLFTNNKYIISYQKSNKLSSAFNVILITAQCISVSLFIYLWFVVYKLEVAPKMSMLYFKIAIIYTVIIICKLLIEKIIAAVFSIDAIIDEYLFYKISYRNYLGMLLLPINILFIYTFTPSKVIFVILFVIIAILNLIILISFYKKNENIVLNHIFYFILYLCALEIAPYFILFKLIE